MSSRSLAAARARRAGENAPPVSGNRPVTSIGSQAAFAQQMPSNMGYNMPPPPNNVRTTRPMQQPPQQLGKSLPQQYQQFYEQPQPQQQQQSNGSPFQKLSVSDAIGLITLRLGRVEQWIIETDHEEESKPSSSTDLSGIPDNHKIIDNSVLNSIINRLNSLEKNGTINSTSQPEETNNLSEEIKTLNEQFKRMGEDVSKHTIELAKNTEQVFRFNRELTETKDILKSFMVKYDMFATEVTQNFTDYETALGELEKRLAPEQVEKSINDIDEVLEMTENNSDTKSNNDGDNTIISVDLHP
jgi:hypothetical protein